MKFVAARDFSNVKNLSIKLPDASHPLHIHKGARFSIGEVDKADDLSADDKEAVIRLTHAKCIVPESDTVAVKRIDGEAKVEAEREKRLKEASAPKSIEDRIAEGIAKGVLAAQAAQKPADPVKK